jgi:hypothetical protein
MALVAYAALACAALRYSTELWASSLFTLAIVLQMFAVLRVALHHGQPRAAWIGVLVFGGGYLLLSSGPWPQMDLITNRGLIWLSQKLHQDPIEQQQATAVSFATGTTLSASQVLLWDASMGRSLVPPPLQPPFLRIGHCLLSPLFGLIGAIVASWLYATSRRSAECGVRNAE